MSTATFRVAIILVIVAAFITILMTDLARNFLLDRLDDLRALLR